MISVDDRAGSQDLAAPLTRLHLPVEVRRMPFGDVAFVGRGEDGALLSIGIEHKRVPDLVNALTTGRFQGHQLPGLLATYDRVWLIVEGDWQHDDQGRVTLFKGGRRGGPRPVKGAPLAVALEQRLLTIELRGGLHVRCCPRRQDTVRFLHGLYRFWTDKDLDEHRSHLAVHAPDMDRGLQLPMSDFRTALQVLLPGIGFAASQAIEQAAGGSFRQLMFWTEDQWATLRIGDRRGTTKQLGRARARKILAALA